MADQEGAAARLGAFVAGCADAALPAPVADKAAFCLLDAFGLGIIAREERTTAAMRSLLTPAGGLGMAARVWADGVRVVLSDAVTANAIAVHAQFHDDSDLSSWTHPGSLIVPVAVCLGEATGATLDSVLRGIVAGYDSLVWLGANERVARALIGRGVRTSPTLGTIGAAATAAAVLELDARQATSAIGMAGSITGGVLEPVRVGSDEWRVQNAHAARGGLLAAQLAHRGVNGAVSSLDGPKGLLHAMAALDEVPPEWLQAPDIEGMLAIVAKPWATLGDNMAAVAAARLIYDGGVDVKQVRRITARIWRPYAEYPGTAYRGPFNETAQALASTVFATAAMLVYGDLEYDISEGKRRDPQILRLAEMTTIEPDDEGGPTDATVEVELADGTTLRRSAKEAPATLLYHDRPTSAAVIERRLAGCGWPAGAGLEIAEQVFECIDRRSDLRIEQLLDRLLPK